MKHITYYQQDYYNNDIWGVRTSLFMFSSQRENVENIVGTRTTLVSGDKVYFSNHVKFPRFKFRDWAHERGIAIVRDPEKATVILIDTTLLFSIIDRFPGYEMNVHKEISDGGIEHTLNYGDPSEIVPNEGPYYKVLTPENEILAENGNSAKLVRLDAFWKHHSDAIDQVSDLSKVIQSNSAIEFLDYPVFVDLIKTDLKMDREMFWEIYYMIKSNDDESRELAIEMLTNIDFPGSKFFMDVLFLTCGGAITSSNTWNKITFKPVIHYMDSINTLQGWKSNRYDLFESSQCGTIIARLVQSYQSSESMDIVNHDFMKELLFKSVQEQKEGINVFGTVITNITFSLDPDIFPNQMKNYEQKKQDSGPQLGEEVSEDTDGDISQYSDEQE